MEFVFAEVATPARSTGGEEALFADDLSVSQKFDRFLPVEDVRAELQTCREQIYIWNKAHRVSFDPQKEHMVVLLPISGDGDHFKLLGFLWTSNLQCSPLSMTPCLVCIRVSQPCSVLEPTTAPKT